MSTYVLITLLIEVFLILLYSFCAILNPELKNLSSEYADYNTHTQSGLLISIDPCFAENKIEAKFNGFSDEKLLAEYSHFLNSTDLLNRLPYSFSLVSFVLCVICELSFSLTIAIPLLVFAGTTILLYIPLGHIITMLLIFWSALYKLTSYLFLNKIAVAIYLIMIGKPVMILALAISLLLQLLLSLILGCYSAIISGVTPSTAIAYNVLGHIVNETHSIFKWVKLNRHFIDNNK